MPTINEYLNCGLYKRRSHIDEKKGKEKEIEIEKLSKEFIDFLEIQDSWVKNGADESMIHFAEITGKFLSPLKKEDKSSLSNSQIRNVYGEIKRIQMNIDVNGWDYIKPSFLMLKPKVAYAAGRNRNLGIVTFKIFFDKAYNNVTNKQEFLNFCNLLESILAFHRAFGGN